MSTGRILWDYLKKNRFVIGGLLTFLAIFCAVFVLYGKPLEAVVYGLLLCLVLTVVLLAVGFVGYYKKIWQLSQLQKMLPELPREFPKSASVGGRALSENDDGTWTRVPKTSQRICQDTE